MSDDLANLEPEAPAPRARRFTLLDMIVLVAIAAVGQRGYMLVLEIYATTGVGSPSAVLSSIRSRGLLAAPYHVVFWFNVLGPLLLAVMTSLFACRRLRPRPTGQVLARQPGSVAISAGFFAALAIFGAWGLVGYPLQRAGKLIALTPTYPFLMTIMTTSLLAAGASVAAGWVNLVLAGGSFREADWPEWAGRILGVVLLLSLPFYLWSSLLYH